MAGSKSFHHVLTLTGSAQPLPDLGAVRWLSLQPAATNAAPVYVGGANISASSYGVRMPAAVTGEPPGPLVMAEFDDGAVSLTEIYVFGTTNEKLHIHVLLYV